MTRRELREHCFKMLFCADFYPAEETAGQLERYFEATEEDETTPEGEIQILHQVDMEEKDREYLLKKAGDALLKVPELDAGINAVAEGWKTRRMGKVELTILRLALYEILHDEEIPEKVAINEAVELAKKFGGDDSPSFINGVLARLVRGREEARKDNGADTVS
ncbi:MAG: transcription antitermination factor NusB [Hungatella sp.]|nr:transcription antitermination factor NusB [Hungatella sp.]